MRLRPRLKTEVARVVRRGNCSGCGACKLVSSAIHMELADDGFLRPVVDERQERAGSLRSERRDVSAFRQVCPGVTLSAPQADAQHRTHAVFGQYISAYSAYATDSAFRFNGSSGGVLSALSGWLVETGRARSVSGCGAADRAPTQTVPVKITSRDAAFKAAGSRYAPAGVAGIYSDDPSDAFVGKPCEVSAVAKFQDLREVPAEDMPLMLSFFCAGTPSQHATDSLVEQLGMDIGRVRRLRYRGNGWPGQFTVEDDAGNRVQASYEDSWGRTFGKQVQWRCKICPDGLGRHADIAVGDFWHSDESGYPIFAESDGVSVLLTRSRRGEELVAAAARDGVIRAERIDIEHVAHMQPLQVRRTLGITGRVLGRWLVGLPAPRYRGFRLLWRLYKYPRLTAREAKGTYVRSRRRP